jgi:hypothetical protein
MKIIGLRIEKYIGTNVEGHNCDFRYYDDELERHVLCAVLSDGKKVEIYLTNEYGECGSGWCTASWGRIEVKEVSRFGGYTHKPIKDLIIGDIDLTDVPENIANDVFSVDYSGYDDYYPSGGYSVDMSLFQQTIRHKDKRPVWIFIGNSNTGKSFLSSKLNELTIYETDSSKILPDVIKEDVVVLGNKYNFEVDEIKKRLFGDCEVCVVKFEIEQEEIN